MNPWIDISVPMKDAMVRWPTDPPPAVRQVAFMDRGDVCNVTRLDISAHTGTHMDAPRHFLRDGAGMESLPLEAVMGPARVIEIQDPVAVTPSELEPYNLQSGERLLFKTRNSKEAWNSTEFFENYVYISKEAANLMGRIGIRTVAIDYLSVGGFHQDLIETHEELLSAGIWIIEGVNLAHVAPGNYELICLPLHIPGSDGAPARAILRSIRPA